LIAKLRRDKRVYAEQLQRNKKAAEQLQNLIQQMIAEENAARERTKQRETNKSRPTMEPFDRAQHRYRPVCRQ
jgi:hypothetical protein